MKFMPVDADTFRFFVKNEIEECRNSISELLVTFSDFGTKMNLQTH